MDSQKEFTELLTNVKTLSGVQYDDQIVDTSGNFIPKKAQFLTLVDFKKPNPEGLADSLNKLSDHYPDIDFLVMDNSDPNMMYAYECYDAPCSYYIEQLDGKAFNLLGH